MPPRPPPRAGAGCGLRCLDGWRRRGRHRLPRRRRAKAESLRDGLGRVAVRHHDNHRLRFSGGDQIVHDDVGPAHRQPRFLVTAAAVEQVEHRILRRARLVARRRVDHHPPAGLLEGRRGIPDGLDGAVRHVLEVPPLGFRARDHQQVVVAGAVALRLAVVGIERLDAVDHEPVAPQLRRQRSDGR